MVVRVAIEHLRDFAESTKPLTILDEVAEAGRKAYCTLYTKNPGWIFVRDNLTLPFVVRFSDDLCRDYQPDTDYTPTPFTGGQCEFNTYNVVIEYIKYTEDGTPTQGITSALAVGKIVDISTFPINPPDSYRCGIRITDNSPSDPRTRVLVIVGQPTVEIKITNIKIDLASGQEDLCGNIVETPFPPPTESPDKYINNYYTVENIFGDKIDYYVEVQKDGDFNLTFPFVYATASFEATLDLGGITIKNRKGSGGGGNPEPLAEEEEEAGESEDTVYERVPRGDKTGGHTVSVDNLVSLDITMTDRPKNASVTHGDGSPDVHYWGWYEFRNGNLNYERIFLQFEGHYAVAPDGATGYAIYYKPGYTGNIVETRVKQS